MHRMAAGRPDLSRNLVGHVMSKSQQMLDLAAEFERRAKTPTNGATTQEFLLAAAALRLAAQADVPQSPGTMKEMADWSSLPRFLYVVSVKSDGIVFDVQCCSVPMAIGAEVRYSLAALSDVPVTRPLHESGK
jgi:hypothetical protein